MENCGERCKPVSYKKDVLDTLQKLIAMKRDNKAFFSSYEPGSSYGEAVRVHTLDSNLFEDVQKET